MKQRNAFDDLARDVAQGLSRRAALRRLGGGLAGALLASLGIGRAWSQGNSDCAQFCTAVFPPGPERGRCVSDATHGTGLCPQCSADVTRVCGAGQELFCCSEPTPICCGGSCLSCSGICGALADQLSACEDLAGQCFVEMGCIVGGIVQNNPDCYATCIAKENVCLAQAVNQLAPCLSQCPPC